MKTNNILTFSRLYLMVRRHVLSSSKPWLIAFGAIAGTMLVMTLLRGVAQPETTGGLTGLYIVVMFVGGYIFTSGIFGELHQVQRSYQYLTLPVSTTERLASAWILTAWIFPLVSVAGMVLIVLIANGIMQLAFDVMPFPSVLTGATWNAVKVYFVTQSVFLLGAAYFRKYNFLKTVLALFVLSLVFQVIIAVMAYTIISPGLEGEGLTLGPQNISQQLETFFGQVVPVAARIVFWYLWTPFFLLTSWFSLKERQV